MSILFVDACPREQSRTRTLAQSMLGILDCCCFKAENLDVIGVDVNAVLAEAEKEIVTYIRKPQ